MTDRIESQLFLLRCFLLPFPPKTPKNPPPAWERKAVSHPEKR